MYFFWVDCEMTGLNHYEDEILEIAFVITDKHMNKIIEKDFIVFHSSARLEQMDNWNQETHKNSGLWNSVLKSNLNYFQLEKEIIEILKKYTSEKKTYLAGNSVYNDYLFIKNKFPLIFNWVHYRILDISSLKLLHQAQDKTAFTKLKKHTALADIKESIEEYLFYKKYLLK